MRITRLFSEFFNSEKSSGLVLIACTVVSLFLANSVFAQDYIHFWEYSFSGHSLEHWVNDGLMSIFFLLIGLELVREIYVGELSGFKSALSPIIAAAGGMLVPAAIYFLANMGLPSVAGAGIPMATDIAFALGVLSLLGKRVPTSLKIFLTALAVIDDLGAILAIAIFYTKSIDYGNLAISLGVFVTLLALNKLKVRSLIPYIIGGIAMWYFMLHSGVHATISGVLLAFTIPFGNGDEHSTSYRLQHFLHWPVPFVILPVFALANTAIHFPDTWSSGLLQPNAMGIFLGLVMGKPLGVVIFTFVFVKLGVTKLAAGLRWRHIIGAGMLAGIGFTMSIFITLLAFDTNEYINSSKIAILFSSMIAAFAGLLFLRFSSPNFVVQEEDNL